MNIKGYYKRGRVFGYLLMAAVIVFIAYYVYVWFLN